MEEVRAEYEPFEYDILSRLNSGDGERVSEPNKSHQQFSNDTFGVASYPTHSIP